MEERPLEREAPQNGRGDGLLEMSCMQSHRSGGRDTYSAQPDNVQAQPRWGYREAAYGGVQGERYERGSKLGISDSCVQCSYGKRVPDLV